MEYYTKNDVESLMKCPSCKNRFDIPKSLPCGNSICIKCEEKYLDTNKKRFKCPVCNLLHDNVPSNGYPVNHVIENFLKMAPAEVYRGEKYKEAFEKIQGVPEALDAFNKKIRNKEFLVRNHCDLLRFSVDIKVESIKKIINKHHEEMIDKINAYEKECSRKCNLVEEYEDYIKRCYERYGTWDKFIQRTDITDLDIENVLLQIEEFEKELKSYKLKLQHYVFGEKMLRFYDNKPEIKLDIIGKLVNIDAISANLDNIFESRPMAIINYKPKTPSISCYQQSFIEIVRNKFCVVLATNEHSNNYWTLNLKIFFGNDLPIKEIKEALSSSQYYFGVCKFNDSIVVGYRGMNDMIRIYDYDLVIKQSLNIDYLPTTVFADDNKIYVHSTSTKYIHIYDEKLTLLESLQTNSTQLRPLMHYSATQVMIRYGKVFSFCNSELRVADLKTKTLLKSIKFDLKYNNEASANRNNNFLLQPFSKDTFVIIDRENKYFELFSLDLECICEFKIENVNQISSFSITDNDHFVILDYQAFTAYVY